MYLLAGILFATWQGIRNHIIGSFEASLVRTPWKEVEILEMQQLLDSSLLCFFYLLLSLGFSVGYVV